MNVSKKYLRLSVLALCITGAGFTLSALPAAPALAADGEKKEDKGETVEVDKLPKAVVDGVKKAIPGAKFQKPGKRLKEGEKVTYFLPDIKQGKQEWDVTVAEDGTIIKKVECHDND